MTTNKLLQKLAVTSSTETAMINVLTRNRKENMGVGIEER
jgi:capsular polysaccharide biosynthesis protein